MSADIHTEFDFKSSAQTISCLLDTFSELGIVGLKEWINCANPVFQRNRSQALAIFPLVIGSIVARPEIPAHIQVQMAIDEGMPLINLVADLSGVERSTVKFLKGKVPHSKAWFGNIVETLRLINMVPPGKRPSSESEWELLASLWNSTCARNNRWRYEATSNPPRQHDLMEYLFVGLCSIGIDECSKRLGENLRRLRNTFDYFRFVGEWCAAGAGIAKINHYVREIARTSLKDEFLKRYSPMELVRQSERWHREILLVDREQQELNPSNPVERWPEIPGLPTTIRELECVSLTSSMSLAVEGERLQHCVGAFTRSCRFGESHIVSIRNRDGDPLSTAEVQLTIDANRNPDLSVIQHRSFENGDPSDLSEIVLAELLDSYKMGHMREELLELYEFHENRKLESELALESDTDDEVTLKLGVVMDRVLRDQNAIDWLDKRLFEEECLYNFRSEKLGEKLQRLEHSYDLAETPEWDIYVRSGEKVWI